MSLDLARSKFERFKDNYGLTSNSSKLLAHNIFPDDFEFYMMGFELVDAESKIVTDRFILPINPDNITIDDTKIKTIKKSAAGVTVQINNSFVPKKISLTGNFGRRFKLLVGNKKTGREGIFKKLDTISEFIPNVKTGYGALKSLQRIFDKSSEETSTGKPYFINFYNLAYNQAYLVEFDNLNPNMGKDMNMIWRYTLNMTAIAPAIRTLGNGLVNNDLIRFSTLGYITQNVDGLTKDISDKMKERSNNGLLVPEPKVINGV